jgi:hypothetical protein
LKIKTSLVHDDGDHIVCVSLRLLDVVREDVLSVDCEIRADRRHRQHKH